MRCRALGTGTQYLFLFKVFFMFIYDLTNKHTINFCLILLFCYLGFYLILDRIRIWILDQQNVVSGSGTLVTCRCNGIQKYRCSSYYCMWCRGLGPGPAGEVYKSNSSLDLDHEIDILQVRYRYLPTNSGQTWLYIKRDLGCPTKSLLNTFTRKENRF